MGNPNPNKDTQFNSKTASEAGKKSKRGKSIKTLLKEFAEKKISKDLTFEEKIAMELITKASEGDLGYIKEYFDRVEGKPTQTIDQTVQEKSDVKVSFE